MLLQGIPERKTRMRGWHIQGTGSLLVWQVSEVKGEESSDAAGGYVLKCFIKNFLRSLAFFLSTGGG